MATNGPDTSNADHPGAGGHTPKGAWAAWRAAFVAALVTVLVAAVAIAAVIWFSSSGTADRVFAVVAPGRTGLAISLVLVGVGAIAFGGLASWLSGERYVGALWLVAPYLPGLAASITVVAYLTSDQNGAYRTDAAFIGLVCGLAAWPLVAFPLRSMCTVDRAQGRAYGELLQRSLQIRERLDALRFGDPATGVALAAAGDALAAPAALAALDAAPAATAAVTAPAAPDAVPAATAAVGEAPAPLGAAPATTAGLDCPPDDPCIAATAAWLEAHRQLEHAKGLLAGERIRPNLAAARELGHELGHEAGASPSPKRRKARGSRERAALPWITGSGYVEIARALHRAEEALIEIEPLEAVVGDALHDDLSLAGSTIDNRDRLRDLIREAVRPLAPNAAAQLLPVGRPTHSQNMIEGRTARAVLREVRHAVNEFRDDARAGLVAARVNLLWAILFVATAAYLLLEVAVLARISATALTAATVFFLIGAVVGLFNRLRIDGATPAAVENFGLYQARLLHTPVVSGLAAVAGVYVVAISPGFFAAIGATAVAAAGGTPDDAAVHLLRIFDLATNPSGLLVAAIFGLAPSTLTRSLADQGATLEKAIQQTQPASKAGSGEAAPS